MKKLNNFILTVNYAGPVRTETFQGELYSVYPVVLLVEGVHVGASGMSLFYSANQLADRASLWNNMPVVVYHPEDNGELVCCESPEVIERHEVGRLFDVQYDSERHALVGEAWINIERASNVRESLLQELNDSDNRMNVSTGFTSTITMQNGTWEEEEYEGIVSNIIPDHLALLPGIEGACNWQDGCGIRLQGSYNNGKLQATFMIAKEKGEFNSKKSREDHKIVILNSTFKLFNELSFGEMYERLQRIVDTLDNEELVHFIEDIYDNYLIIRAMPRSIFTSVGQLNPDERQSPIYMKCGYKKKKEQLDGADALELVGEPRIVRREVNYIEVNTSINNTQGEDTMSKKCCAEIIEGLIANTKTPFTKDSQDFLQSLSEDNLNQLNEADWEHSGIVIVTNREPEKTIEEYVSNAPDVFKKELESKIAIADDSIQALIGMILNVEGNTFTEDQLKDMDYQMLKSFHTSLVGVKEKNTSTDDNGGDGGQQQTNNQQQTNFSGAAGAAGAGDDGEEVFLETPKLKLVEEK